jgi:phosphatidylserine decarboxylase
MRQASVGIAPEGYPFLFLCGFSALIFAVIDCRLTAFLLLCATWCIGHFFRDPERVTPSAPGLAVSPADGKVIRLHSMPDPFNGEPRPCISIFMNVLNVHVNRSPVTATVKAVAYFPGSFVNASRDKASTDNERCAYSLESKDGTFSVVQIAGLIARRIVCRVDEGDTLQRGQRIGLIRFGSRVDLYLPDGYIWTVRVGDRVTAGESVLARRGNTFS